MKRFYLLCLLSRDRFADGSLVECHHLRPHKYYQRILKKGHNGVALAAIADEQAQARKKRGSRLLADVEEHLPMEDQPSRRELEPRHRNRPCGRPKASDRGEISTANDAGEQESDGGGGKSQEGLEDCEFIGETDYEDAIFEAPQLSSLFFIARFVIV